MTVVRLSTGRVAALLRATRLSRIDLSHPIKTVGEFSLQNHNASVTAAVVMGVLADHATTGQLYAVIAHNTLGGYTTPYGDYDTDAQLRVICDNCRDDLRNGVQPLLVLTRYFNAFRKVDPVGARWNTDQLKQRVITLALELEHVDIDVKNVPVRYKSEVVYE